MEIKINKHQLEEIMRWVQQHPGHCNVEEVFHIDDVSKLNIEDIKYWIINTLEYYLKEEMGYEFGLND